MPGSDGLTILKEIRKQGLYLPVIALTSQGNEKLAVSLLKTGAHDYIVKSEIHSLDLREIVVNAISSSEANNSFVDKRTARTNVLIVDDNIDDRELVKRTLNKANKYSYSFLEVTSGIEVSALLEKNQPNCVLLDYSLPGEDGLTVLQKISNCYPFVPVIIISGQGSENVAAEAIKNGAFHYLVKSELTPELLDETVRKSLEKKSLEQIVHQKNEEVKHHQYKAIQRKKRFDRVVQATNIVVWEYDIVNDALFIDEQISILLGESFKASHLKLEELRSYIHPDDITMLNDHWQAHLQGVDHELDIVYRFQNKSGIWLWLRETGKVVETDIEGKPSKIAGLYEDISEKKYEEDVLNKFYTLTVDDKLSLDQKISSVLRLGLLHFNLDVGIVSKITGGTYEVVHCEPSDKITPGQLLPLSQTYCSQVFSSSEVKAWHNIGKSDIAEYPCYQSQRNETYIGTTIFLNNSPYGTLSFARKKPFSKPFSSRRKVLLSLIAQWLSSEITREFNLREIEESKNFMQLVQDSIPDLIFVKDDNFRIVRANPAFLNLYPKPTRDSVIGTTTLESYDEAEAEAFLQQDKLALKEGKSEIEETIHFPDGKKRTLYTKKIRFQDREKNRFVLGPVHTKC